MLFRSMLNLIYNLQNTTYDTIEDTRVNLRLRLDILLNHLHPIETATAPDMISRRASITFTNIASGNNVVIGPVTYTFVTVLGNPALNNVQVLIQGTLRSTVKILANAIIGDDDATNIVYGQGTDSNPVATAYWTSQRFSIGDVTIVPSESLFVLEKAENMATVIPLNSTAAASITPFIRTRDRKSVV